MQINRNIFLRTQDSLVSVDREAGTIHNIAVITAGQTKAPASGGGPLMIDRVTLQQIADQINKSAIGVKSRLTHPETMGVDDLPCRLGYIRNARVEGNTVRADMFFHDPKSTTALVLMDIASHDPASCGLSIALDHGQSSLDPNNQALRVNALMGVDWVGEPAANPAGMLSAEKKLSFQGTRTMEYTPAQLELLKSFGLIEGATPEQVAVFVDGLTDEQKQQLAGLASTDLSEKTEESEPVAVSEETDKEETPMVAASAKKPSPKQDDKPTAPVALSAADIQLAAREAVAEERLRVEKINNIALKAGLDQQWVNKQIKSGNDVGAVALAAIDAQKRSPEDMTTTTVTGGADRNLDTLGPGVQSAIMLRAGRQRFVKFDDGGQVMLSANRAPEASQPHERANEFRGHSVIEIGRRYLSALGYKKADSMGRTELATLLMSKHRLQAALPGVYLAHSTGDFPFLLADTMGKVLRAEYALAPHTWNMWSRKATAPDFKDIKKLQLSEAADLVLKPENDEYEYGTLTESKEVYRLSTYAKGLKFSREMLINDDLSAFDRVPSMMGRAAARKVEGIAIAVLTANAALADSIALFATGHANITTGALSVTSLGVARAALRKQTAFGSSDPLELTPRFLLVPETIATTAQQLVSSTVDPAKQNATPNPFANTLQVIPSARLDINSTTQWYLLADPSEIDTVEVSFLEGEETPVVEEEDEFDTDARKIKIRHTVAAKAIDYRGMVRSSGS